MLLFSILGGILALLLLFLFVPTFLGVDYLMQEGDNRLRLRCRVLGIPFSFHIPLNQQEEDEKKDKPKPAKEKKAMTPKRFIALSKELYRGYQAAEEEIFALLRDMKKRFACRELYFSVRYGTHNPAVTGMLNGAVWTAAGLILKILDSALCIRKKTLNIHPDFQQACMCLHIKSTFRFKLIDAVRFVLKVTKLVKLIKSYITSLEEEKAV